MRATLLGLPQSIRLDPGFRVLCTSRRISSNSRAYAPAGSSGPQSLALQNVDLLATYRGLVELGKIQFDENQVRVVMQVRSR